VVFDGPTIILTIEGVRLQEEIWNDGKGRNRGTKAQRGRLVCCAAALSQEVEERGGLNGLFADVGDP
jgi:hypothetical protein